jgi:glycosyltransferase involved in cell wall biosynthesis
VEKEVTLTGFRSDISRLVSAFDIYVFPGLKDSNPRSVLEAMALRRPIIAGNGGGVPEMLANGGCGILVEPPCEGGQMAAVVKDLLGNNSKAQELGKLAQQYVVQEYAMEKVAGRIERAFSNVLRYIHGSHVEEMGNR